MIYRVVIKSSHGPSFFRGSANLASSAALFCFAFKKSSLDLPSFFFQNSLMSRDGNYMVKCSNTFCVMIINLDGPDLKRLFDFIALCLFNYLGGEDKKTSKMWGPPSQLDLPYDVRHSLRFKDKHQRPLTDKENSILEKLKKVDPNNFGKKFKGLFGIIHLKYFSLI
jgi:hypothetical protein